MKRRWFIRICFMLPILLCVGGWIWSATHLGIISIGHAGHWVEWQASQGGLSVTWGTGEGRFNGWYCGGGDRAYEAHYWPTNSSRYYLGFLYGYYAKKDGSSVSYLEVPFWFLIIVTSAILYLAWRKTAQPKSPPAFPVIMPPTGKHP